MQNQDDVIGFYQVADEISVGAFRAYLNAPASGIKVYTFGDGATGIGNLNADLNANLNGAIYNLAGQRISKPQKGINIINNKKIVK